MAKDRGVKRIEGETARQRSVRLANKRVSSALKYMELVGNLAGVGYQLSEDEKSKITHAMKEGFDKLNARFAGETVANDRFKL